MHVLNFLKTLLKILPLFCSLADKLVSSFVPVLHQLILGVIT